jgi:4-amino-4-deoxy-L-arabinose transferase-like glycosyltransferase
MKWDLSWRACLLGWLAAIACWLWDVVGSGTPLAISRGVVLLALMLTVIAIVRWMLGMWHTNRWLLLLTVAALIVHWIGVDWEVRGRYYRDEGIYFAAANAINEGQLFPESFIYGHLPYYVYALTLWVQSLFPKALAWLLGIPFTVVEDVDVSWILLRGINTTLGALTTVPVFIVGQRIAGRLAAVLGSLLIIFSPIFNEISRLIISDVPSAFFAALSVMFVSMLLDEERYGPYLLAGITAGLAAASKYPAGVVAVAIIGIWVAWRMRTRRWSWHLVAAGAVALATFIAVMPAFLVHSDAVFVGEGKDLLFGFRQYGKRGWIGVMPESNAAWYGGQLLTSFGLPALILGALGWPWLGREQRRRWLWMLPFPVFYLILLASMSMVVKRNLLPAIPAIAALLGAGLAGWLMASRRRWPTSPTVRWASLFVAVALAVPVYKTVTQTIAFSRQSTRELAADWINTHVPKASAIIKESYTPHLDKAIYQVHQTRFAARTPIREVRSGEWDYVLLAVNAYGRFLEPENWEKPHHEAYASNYEQMLQFEKVKEFVPNPIRMGPSLELYKVDPWEVVYQDRFVYAFEGEGFRYPRGGAYLLFKEYMQPGSYRFELDTDPPAAKGRIEIVTREGQEAGLFFFDSSAGLAELPWRAKYFFFTYLPKDTVITGWRLLPVGTSE